MYTYIKLYALVHTFIYACMHACMHAYTERKSEGGREGAGVRTCTPNHKPPKPCTIQQDRRRFKQPRSRQRPRQLEVSEMDREQGRHGFYSPIANQTFLNPEVKMSMRPRIQAFVPRLLKQAHNCATLLLS